MRLEGSLEMSNVRQFPLSRQSKNASRVKRFEELPAYMRALATRRTSLRPAEIAKFFYIAGQRDALERNEN